MSTTTNGQWGGSFDWPLIGIHAIVTGDGKVLTFGTDQNGMQSGQFIYDVWDPASNEHFTLANTTPTDIFCSAAILIPETGDILISGGDRRPLGEVNAGVNDVNIFSSDDMTLQGDPLGDMAYQRWYPTMVTLNTGQIVILGGSDGNHRGVGAVEMYTPGEGWRTLAGAYNAELAENSSYPRAWVNGNDEIIYLPANPGGDGANEIYAMSAAGDGSVRKIGTLPFDTSWSMPSATYAPGKAMIMGHGGEFWSMDFSSETLSFTRMASLPQTRYWSDMTVMADGRILLNGGTSQNSTSSSSSSWDMTAAIWDPETDTWTETVDEDLARLYHSASLLLPDGSLLSLGGGAPGPQTNLNGEVYKPDYLFDADGNLADRPVIEAVQDSIAPDGTLTVTMDEAASIARLTFVKTGASTHSFNMDQSFVELDFTRSGDNLIATLPENDNLLTAGNWMLFAWNNDGVPSVAKIVGVQTTGEYYDGVGELHAEYFVIDSDAASLADVDFDAEPAYEADVHSLQTANDYGSAWPGGPVDDFAVRYTGKFDAIESGSYRFYLTSDDGAALYIDGNLAISNDGLHGPTLREASIALDSGSHTIEVRYFEAGGPGTLELDWSGPTFSPRKMIFDGPGFSGPEVVSDGAAPTDIALSSTSVAEDAPDGTVVGVLSATDPDTASGFTYTITEGDGTNFEIVGDELRVKSGAQLDYEIAPDRPLTVSVDDGEGNTYAETFNLSVTDANDAPLDIRFDRMSGSGIALNTDGGNDAFLTTTVGGPIVGGLGAMTLEVSFESANLGSSGASLFSYHTGGSSDEIELTVYRSGSGAHINFEVSEDTATTSGYDATALFDGQEHRVSATWDNASGDWAIYVDGALVDSGTGLATGQTIDDGGAIVIGQEQDSQSGGFDPDAAISGTVTDVRIFNTARTAQTISDNADTTVDSSEPGLVSNWRMDDLVGLFTSNSGPGNALIIGNVVGDGWTASAPRLIAGVYEDSANGSLVGEVSALDPDVAGTHSYALVDNANGAFAIDSVTGRITVANANRLDFETAPTVDITVRATDQGGLSVDKTFSIAIFDGDDVVDPVDDLLVNGDLEQPANASLFFGDLDGWQSTAGAFEHWADGFQDTPAYSGNGFVELDNGEALDNLFQDIDTEDGQHYKLTFAGRQRDGGEEAIEVYWGGEKIATVSPESDGEWTEFTLGVTGTADLDRLEFRERAGDNNGLGPFIDGIALEAVDVPIDNPDPLGDLLVNGDLEQPVNASLYFGDLDGWQSSAGSFEHWADGFQDIPAYSGNGFVELDNGEALDNLFQDIDTEEGQHYKLTFAGRQRDGGEEAIEVYWGGEKIATVSPKSDGEWTEFTLGVTGTADLDRLEFRERAGDNNGLGPFIDGIALEAVDEPIDNPDPLADLLVNGGLEQPINASLYFGDLDGWQSAAGSIEHWADGFEATPAHSGNGFVELDNGDELDSLFQDVETDAGQTYTLSFAARQRDGVEESVELYWNGARVDTYTPTTADEWQVFTVDVAGTGGLERLEFREFADENNGLGPFIDSISLEPADFLAPTV